MCDIPTVIRGVHFLPEFEAVSIPPIRENFSEYAEKCYTALVLTIVLITFTSVEYDCAGVLNVLWDFSVTSTISKEAEKILMK